MNSDTGIKGYRYITSNGRIYFIEILAFGEYVDKSIPDHKAFYTRDCIVTRIIDPNSGRELNSVYGMGIGYRNVMYTKNERITGYKTYYCHSIDDLLDPHVTPVIKKEDGTYCMTLTSHMRYYQTTLAEARNGFERARKSVGEAKNRIYEYAKKRGLI